MSDTAVQEGDLAFRTEDHPEANGRKPCRGEQAWEVFFTLEDGRKLILHMGREGHASMRRILLQEMQDDEFFPLEAR